MSRHLHRRPDDMGLEVFAAVAIAGLVLPAACWRGNVLLRGPGQAATTWSGWPCCRRRARQCAQWSSYDRASKYDEATGKYVNWDANGDGGGIIRREGEQVVMAEMEGPGCIWRIWSATAEKGHVKIYLDGQRDAGRRPAVHRLLRRQARPVQLPAALLSARRRQAAAGRTSTSRSPTRSRARSWPTKAGGRYYHFVYATYPQGNEVPTFSPQLAAEERRGAARRSTTSSATQLGTDPAGPRQGERDASARRRRSPPGRPRTVAELDRPAGDHRHPRARCAVQGPRGRDGRPAQARRCRSPGTARPSRPSGARWATSSAPPRA